MLQNPRSKLDAWSKMHKGVLAVSHLGGDFGQHFMSSPDLEALPQAPWSGKAARFMANSSTPHLWAHVRQFFLKSLMFYIFFGWCRCDGAMSSHKTLVKTFAFGPKHCMMTGGNQPTMAGTREFRASSTVDDETSPCLARLAGGSISWREHDKNDRLRTRG